MFSFVAKGVKGSFFILVSLLLVLNLFAAAKKEKQGEKAKGKKNEKAVVVPDGGEIVFPREGSIDYNEGTFEIWFKLAYNIEDPMVEDKSFRVPVKFLSFHRKNDDKYSKEKDKKGPPYKLINHVDNEEAPTITIYIEHREAGGGVIVCASNLIDRKILDRKVPQIYAVKGLTFKADEWHFIALSWKKVGEQYECNMRIDGESLPTITASACNISDMSPEGAIIKIGSTEDSLFAVNSFRISKTARTEEQLKNSFEKGLSADSDTLLFQNGESLAKLKKSEKLTADVDKKGQIFGANKFIDGKFGKALLLHVPGKK